jgi:two-component system sensor histidine kinase PilS (NtrC family)
MNEPQHAFTQAPLFRRVQGLMLGRVIVISFLWVALVGVELGGDSTPARLPLAYVTLTTYGLTILYALLLRQPQRLERFYLWQVSIDLLIETAILHTTGGLDSGFSFLYILSIIAAGIALPGRSIFGIAAGASILYSTLAYLDFHGIIHPLPFPFTFKSDMSVSGSYALYTTCLMLTAFWGVAWLSRTLADSLRHTGEVLQAQTAHLVGLRAFHENVINSMNSGVLITDMAGRIVSANHAAERILLLFPETAPAHSAQEIFSFLDIGAILQQAGTLSCDLNRAEGLFERRDGIKIILGLSYAPLRDEKDTLHGLIFNFQDITAIRTMEAEMQRDKQLSAVGRLSAAIAHEIRNPLASISGSIQLLRSKLVLDESTQRLMEITAREVERLNAIITDFLAYARPRPLQYAEIDLHQLITGMLSLLANGLPEGSTVTARTEFAPEVSSVQVDPQGLRQVIWNLCLNAVDAMQSQGTLIVRTAVRPQPNQLFRLYGGEPQAGTPELTIEVEDTGPGMPPDVQEKIFEPFFSTKDGGTGLGLATVHRIIGTHKGRIEVESQPGHGTTMRICLPLPCPPPNATDASSPR